MNDGRRAFMELRYVLWPQELGSWAVPGRDRLQTLLYLDRADGHLSRSLLALPDASLEVRLRSDAGSFWVEIQEKDGKASWEQRFRLSGGLIGRFLQGDLDERDLPDHPRGLDVIRELAAGQPLVPRGSVRCLRRVLEESPAARVTLDQKITYHLSSGPPALEESAAIVTIRFRGPWCPEKWRMRLESAGPVEYSEFLILAGLAQSDRLAAASLRPGSA
jgi:hypothetical protein